MDFIILETELVANPKNHILIILGRLFLTIVNAQINYQNGLMKLSFGNTSVDLNIFVLTETNQTSNMNWISENTYEPLDLSDEEFDYELWMNQDCEEFEEVNEVAAISMEPRWEPLVQPLSRPLVEETPK